MHHKTKHTGLRRLRNAAHYSKDGFVAVYRSEEAFRQEVWISAVALPLSFFLADSALQWLLLIGVLILLLLVELINSAIEAIVDRFGKKWHPLCKVAKDAGSAAVLLMSILAGLCWVVVLLIRLNFLT